MGFSEGDIGVLPPLGVWDPLGYIDSRDMRRYEEMEIKHGRAAMLGFTHVILTEVGLRFPGYLSDGTFGGAPIKFADVPWVRYDDPEARTFKLNVERQNGRAAMLGIT